MRVPAVPHPAIAAARALVAQWRANAKKAALKAEEYQGKSRDGDRWGGDQLVASNLDICEATANERASILEACADGLEGTLIALSSPSSTPPASHDAPAAEAPDRAAAGIAPAGGEAERCPTCGAKLHRNRWSIRDMQMTVYAPQNYGLSDYRECRDPWHDAPPPAGAKP